MGLLKKLNQTQLNLLNWIKLWFSYVSLPWTSFGDLLTWIWDWIEHHSVSSLHVYSFPSTLLFPSSTFISQHQCNHIQDFIYITITHILLMVIVSDECNFNLSSKIKCLLFFLFWGNCLLFLTLCNLFYIDFMFSPCLTPFFCVQGHNHVLNM